MKGWEGGRETGRIRNKRTDFESRKNKLVKSLYISQVEKLQQLISKDRTLVRIISGISPRIIYSHKSIIGMLT